MQFQFSENLLDNVGVVRKLLEEQNFSKCPLRVGCVAESVENFLKRDDSTRFAFGRFPHNPIRTLPYNIND